MDWNKRCAWWIMNTLSNMVKFLQPTDRCQYPGHSGVKMSLAHFYRRHHIQWHTSSSISIQLWALVNGAGQKHKRATGQFYFGRDILFKLTSFAGGAWISNCTTCSIDADPQRQLIHVKGYHKRQIQTSHLCIGSGIFHALPQWDSLIEFWFAQRDLNLPRVMNIECQIYWTHITAVASYACIFANNCIRLFNQNHQSEFCPFWSKWSVWIWFLFLTLATNLYQVSPITTPNANHQQILWDWEAWIRIHKTC